MSHSTVKTLAVWGALSLAGMAQTAFGQWMPFGDSCGCGVPEIPASICGPTCGVACAPPQPQFVMQPVTEMQTCERIVNRPVYETKYVPVTQTEYHQVMETRTATVPTCSYRNVTEMQTRQRDCGRWVTNYRCRQFVPPCAYDNRPGLFGMMNRALYTARMSVTPAVVAERTYVPNVITEQIPVTRQVAVHGTQQVTYQVPRTVASTTTRQVAVREVRMVAERVQERVPVTTMRMVPYGASAMAFGSTGVGTAGLPGYNPTLATPDNVGSGLRTTSLPDDLTPATSIPKATGPRATRDSAPPTPPVPDVPKGQGRVIPPRDVMSDDIVEEVASSAKPVRHSVGYRPIASPVQVATSAPSIVRVSQWNRRPAFEQPAEDVTVAAAAKSKPKVSH